MDPHVNKIRQQHQRAYGKDALGRLSPGTILEIADMRRFHRGVLLLAIERRDAELEEAKHNLGAALTDMRILRSRCDLLEERAAGRRTVLEALIKAAEELGAASADFDDATDESWKERATKAKADVERLSDLLLNPHQQGTVWRPFPNELPPVNKHVIVRLSEYDGTGRHSTDFGHFPASAVFGYMNFAGGDRSCPRFITPGIDQAGRIVTHWVDCLPAAAQDMGWVSKMSGGTNGLG